MAKKIDDYLHSIMKHLTEVESELCALNYEIDPKHLDKFNTEWVQVHLDTIQVRLNKLKMAKRKRNRIVLSDR